MNMNKYIKSLGMAALALSMIACSDSFLEKEPNGYINSDQLEENAAWNPYVMLGQMNGISAKTFEMGTGGTSNHDDFGQKSIDIATDLMSGDMVMSGETYGWFSSDARLLNNTKNRQRAYSIWRYYFQIIKAANSIFDTVGGDGNMPEEGTDNRAFYGQAKVMRAYAYFNLVNLYAKPYDVAKDEKALPFYSSQLTPTTAGLSTVGEIYEHVISDLKEAATALDGYVRDTKDMPDLSLAYGLLAYACLQTGQYEEAAQYAEAVIESGQYPLMNQQEIINSGFRSVDISEFMWAIDLTADNTPALPTFWGHVDLFTYSYAAAGDLKMIPDNLYNEIPVTDMRKNWFCDPAYEFVDYIPWRKFYAKEGEKYQVMGDRLWENDEVYMRVAEMYLIAAEANARAGETMLPKAKTALRTLLLNRDETTAATVDAMTAEELLDAIYFNWRVEMWGEGRGLMTMKRFKKAVVRGENDFAWPGTSISYDDERLYFEIPENETTNNPNL